MSNSTTSSTPLGVKSPNSNISALDISHLKVAILGAGLMGKWHAHYADRLGADIVAVIDNDLSVAASLAKKFDASAYDNLAQLTDDQYDVLHICTPASTHVQYIEQALSAKKHVIVEKPLGENLTDVISLAKLAKEKEMLLCPVHQFPFQSGINKLKAELSNRDNKPLHVEFTIASAGAIGFNADEINQVLVEILPHPLSILAEVWEHDFLGTNADEWDVHNPQAGELFIYGCSAGFPVTIKLSMNARPTQCKMTVHHKQGAIHLNLFHGFAVMESARVSKLNKIFNPFIFSLNIIWHAGINLIYRLINKQMAYPGLESLIEKCYIAISKGEPSPISDKNYIFVTETGEYIKSQMSPR